MKLNITINITLWFLFEQHAVAAAVDVSAAVDVVGAVDDAAVGVVDGVAFVQFCIPAHVVGTVCKLHSPSQHSQGQTYKA